MHPQSHRVSICHTYIALSVAFNSISATVPLSLLRYASSVLSLMTLEIVNIVTHHRLSALPWQPS